jgi:hypothetical protein
MDNFFLLIGICVVLPIIVVTLNNRTSQNETNKKTEVILKAIESGVTIDPEYFKPQLREKSLKEKLLGRLTGACVVSAIGLAICIATAVIGYVGGSVYILELIVVGAVALAIGIALFISYFVGRQMLADEIKAEEESHKRK